MKLLFKTDSDTDTWLISDSFQFQLQGFGSVGLLILSWSVVDHSNRDAHTQRKSKGGIAQSSKRSLLRFGNPGRILMTSETERLLVLMFQNQESKPSILNLRLIGTFNSGQTETFTRTSTYWPLSVYDKVYKHDCCLAILAFFTLFWWLLATRLLFVWKYHHVKLSNELSCT